MKIYLAGPLFTSAERAWNKQLEQLLVQIGHEVFLPQEKELKERTAKTIFEADLVGLDWAEVLVAILDGPDPDSGTCWECGYAYRKKPVVVVRTDFRGSADSELGAYNPMLTASASAPLHLPFATVQQVADALRPVLAELSSNPQ